MLAPHDARVGEQTKRTRCLCANYCRVQEVASRYMLIDLHRISSVGPFLNFLPDGRPGSGTTGVLSAFRGVPFTRFGTLSQAPEPSLLAAPFFWRCSVCLYSTAGKPRFPDWF